MTPPTGMIVLPPNVSYSAAQLIRANLEPQLEALYVLPNFGVQVSTRTWPPSPIRPATGYARYRYDLYGPAGRDWFGVLNAGLLAALVSLVIAVAATLSGVIG